MRVSGVTGVSVPLRPRWRALAGGGGWLASGAGAADVLDDEGGVEPASVLEADCSLVRVGGAATQLDAVAAAELPQAGAHQQIAPLGAAAPAAVQRRRDQPEMVAPEVQAPAEQPARHARDPRAL